MQPKVRRTTLAPVVLTLAPYVSQRQRPAQLSGSGPPQSGLSVLVAHDPLRLRRRRLGRLRVGLPVAFVNGRVVRSQVTGHGGTHAICAALGADRQGIE